MKLVVDASVAFWACGGTDRFDRLEAELSAPPLLWSEVASSLHAAVWRAEVSMAMGLQMLDLLHDAPVEPTGHPDLRREAWRIADELGWAKTYDAEYIALAHLSECRLVTLDSRLRRGADRLGMVVSLEELLSS